MSIVSIQIGQCGNQLGCELFNTIYRDCFECPTALIDDLYSNFSVEKFFHVTDPSQPVSRQRLEARCVQIDMEQKAIARLTNQSSEWYYSDKYCLTGRAGSGNNWALGYCKNGQGVIDSVEPLLQHQLESCDRIDGFLITMSLAGGTGSGIGTRLIETLPDLVPKSTALSQLIWPFSRGEITVQSYNAILSLGHLLASCGTDGAFLIQHNDLLQQACMARQLATTNPSSSSRSLLSQSAASSAKTSTNGVHRLSVGLDDINRLASHQLASLLQPVDGSSTTPSLAPLYRLTNLLTDLCGHPDYRLIRLRCVPYYYNHHSRPSSSSFSFATDSWQQLGRQAHRLLASGAPSEDCFNWTVSSSTGSLTNNMARCQLPLLSSVIINRGMEADVFSKSFTQTCPINDLRLSCDPLTRQGRLQVYHSNRPFNGGYPRSLVVASNGGGLKLDGETSFTNTADFLESLIERFWQLLASRAYLHQYDRYGIGQTELLDCLAVVEQVKHCYGTL